MLELNEIAMSDTSSMEVLHPKDGKPTGAFIEAYGTHTKHFNKVAKEMIEFKDIEPDEYEIILLTKMTKSIKGFIENGKEYKSDEKNIRNIYESSAIIRKQLDRFIYQQTNFFLNK